MNLCRVVSKVVKVSKSENYMILFESFWKMVIVHFGHSQFYSLVRDHGPRKVLKFVCCTVCQDSWKLRSNQITERTNLTYFFHWISFQKIHFSFSSIKLNLWQKEHLHLVWRFFSHHSFTHVIRSTAHNFYTMQSNMLLCYCFIPKTHATSNQKDAGFKIHNLLYTDI